MEGVGLADQELMDLGKCAMEERCRNTVILAKRRKMHYKEW